MTAKRDDDTVSPPLIGLAPLMRRAYAGDNLFPLGEELLARAQADAADANARLDLSTVLQLTGNRANALALQADAVAAQAHYFLPATRPEAGPGLRLLVLMALGDLMGNTPVEFLVENSDVSLDMLYLAPDVDWPDEVPEHDVMLVAVAESEANQPLLARVADYVRGWPRPIINRPEQIAMLSRDGVCRALDGVAGIELPASVRVRRDQLAALADGALALGAVLPDGRFPIIVRPLGSHAGTDLEKMDTPAELHAYLAHVGGEQFYIARFVDYRGADGMFRKYRIVLVAGAPYICHLAISVRWMIHYLNAGMTDSADKRQEEADGMASFETGFARRHAQALREIDQRLGLPYVGIDCAETADGKLLIFEADNAMIVHGMDPVDMFAYKKPAMEKVFHAFRALLDTARTAG